MCCKTNTNTEIMLKNYFGEERQKLGKNVLHFLCKSQSWNEDQFHKYCLSLQRNGPMQHIFFYYLRWKTLDAPNASDTQWKSLVSFLNLPPLEGIPCKSIINSSSVTTVSIKAVVNRKIRLTHDSLNIHILDKGNFSSYKMKSLIFLVVIPVLCGLFLENWKEKYIYSITAWHYSQR